MAAVIKTAIVAMPAGAVWDAVSDVGNVPALTSMVTESTLDGDKRVCTLADGQTLSETILSVDHDNMRVAYRVHDSPFALDEHAASIVVSTETGQTRVTWTTDFKPDAAKDAFQDAADKMFSDLLARFNGAVVDA